MGEAAYFGFDSVLPLPPTPKKPPHPLFIVSLWTPVILAEPVGWVDFQGKKPAAELAKRPLWSNPESYFFPHKKADFEPPFDPFDNFTNQRI